MPNRARRYSGNIEKRGKDSWRLRYWLPPDATGLRKQATKTVHGNKSDAQNKLRELIQQVKEGSYVIRDTQTIADFMDVWFKADPATQTTLRTQQGYRQKIERYIKPEIGNIELQSLTPERIESLYSKMLNEDGLSARTILHTHRILRKALTLAVDRRAISRNPAGKVKPPRPEAREMPMWDIAIIRRFLEAASASNHKDYYHLCILTGMRRSELSGLKWDVVDFDASRIRVVRTLQRISGKGLMEGQPKTARSRRSIALDSSAVEILKNLRTRQLEQRLFVGSAWRDLDFVFTQEGGRPLDPDKLTHDFQSIVRTSGLPHLTLHGLRHAHATILLAADVHPKIVSDRLGHSSIAITMDTYSHVLPDMQERAANALEEQLGVG